jgi:uncharacterized protein GlcG (DUF336 family)
MSTAHKTLQLPDARRIIAAATKKAEEIGQPMNIAVVCAGGHLLAFERMEGAWLGSVDIAQKKAFTSRAFDIETGTLGTLSQSGDQFFGIHASNDGKIMIFAGGVPVKQDGVVIGAVGVSGGLGAQDQAVAEAGVAAF